MNIGFAWIAIIPFKDETHSIIIDIANFGLQEEENIIWIGEQLETSLG